MQRWDREKKLTRSSRDTTPWRLTGANVIGVKVTGVKVTGAR